jgi:cold shock CspA family protein/ribosome-associated translation inhibitor RaiA
MQLAPQVTFRNMDPSPAVEARVRRKVAGLERFFPRVTGCSVLVEAPHRHHRKGKLYHVRIDLTVPGEELVVGRGPAEHEAHQDVYVAVRDAFDAVRRELEDYARRADGRVKVDVRPARGRVTKLFPREDYGFLEASDGREIYFHRNSVLDDFDRLSPGAHVRFAEEAGEKGPQASTVAAEE